jgi:hypothetical protein
VLSRKDSRVECEMKVVVRTRWRAGRLAGWQTSRSASGRVAGSLLARGRIDAGGPPLARQPGAGITMAFTRLHLSLTHTYSLVMLEHIDTTNKYMLALFSRDNS